MTFSEWKVLGLHLVYTCLHYLTHLTMLTAGLSKTKSNEVEWSLMEILEIGLCQLCPQCEKVTWMGRIWSDMAGYGRRWSEMVAQRSEMMWTCFSSCPIFRSPFPAVEPAECHEHFGLRTFEASPQQFQLGQLSYLSLSLWSSLINLSIFYLQVHQFPELCHLSRHRSDRLIGSH